MPPAPPPVKPAETTPAPSMDSGPSAAARAEELTSKGLTAKIAANPEDVNARYRRGQVYASKGAAPLALQDFDETLRLNAKDVEAVQEGAVAGHGTGATSSCS